MYVALCAAYCECNYVKYQLDYIWSKKVHFQEALTTTMKDTKHKTEIINEENDL